MENREELNNILKDELEILKSDIINRHELAGQVASGKTIEGYSTETDLTPTGVEGSLMGYEYVRTLETGRGAGKIPYNFEEIIEKWIDDTGISFDVGDDESPDKAKKRFAAAIAWKIRREGSFLFRFGYHVDIFETPLNDMEDRITKRISDKMSIDITNDIYNQLITE